MIRVKRKRDRQPGTPGCHRPQHWSAVSSSIHSLPFLDLELPPHEYALFLNSDPHLDTIASPLYVLKPTPTIPSSRTPTPACDLAWAAPLYTLRPAPVITVTVTVRAPLSSCLRCLRRASASCAQRAFIIPRAGVCIPFLRIGAGVYAFLTAPPSDSAAPMGDVYHLCRRS
ncbi:hypothetical protein C8R44DRAFT_882343 [Mycena epipterygia]|nr:hypothetical protein C8R44DRAFT_882343 [Mycena epipterygia]